MSDTCMQCGREFVQIANHWTQSSCDRPSFTQHQREVITGLLMGDGSINRQNGRNPRIETGMISPNYLRHVDKQLGVFGKGVSLKCTAKESAKQCRDRGFGANPKAENYSDVYRWQSMHHPELQEFADWYASGKKVWPKDIKLTPTVLKHWYCCDGHYHTSGSHNRIKIAMFNEVENTEKIDKMFTNVGLPAPSNYDIQENSCTAEWTVKDSKVLWEYMGEPLPDFGYKWPAN